MKKTPRTYYERTFQERYKGLMEMAELLRKNDPPFSLEEADRWLADLVRYFGIDKKFDRKTAAAIVKTHQVHGRIPPMTERAIMLFFAALALGKARYEDVLRQRTRHLPDNRMPMEERLTIVRDVDNAPGETKYEKFCYVAAQRHRTLEAIKKMYYKTKKGNDELLG